MNKEIFSSIASVLTVIVVTMISSAASAQEFDHAAAVSPGLSYCHLTVKHPTDAGAAINGGWVSEGGGQVLATVEEGKQALVALYCPSRGSVTPSGSPIGGTENIRAGHGWWLIPSTGQSPMNIAWSGDNGQSERISIRWNVVSGPASSADLQAIDQQVDAVEDRVEVVESKLDQKHAGLFLGYIGGVDAAINDEPGRHGFNIMAEGYIPFWKKAWLRFLVGGQVDHNNFAVPVINAPNLQPANAYVDGSKTYAGINVGLNARPVDWFFADLRLGMGAWIMYFGTTPLSQTEAGDVFVGQATTEVPLAGNFGLDAMFGYKYVFG
ncbi:MAG: hypothetical protein ACRCZE_02965, partial [Candidatus Altimarinota bacterium]